MPQGYDTKSESGDGIAQAMAETPFSDKMYAPRLRALPYHIPLKFLADIGANSALSCARRLHELLHFHRGSWLPPDGSSFLF